MTATPGSVSATNGKRASDLEDRKVNPQRRKPGRGQGSPGEHVGTLACSLFLTLHPRAGLAQHCLEPGAGELLSFGSAGSFRRRRRLLPLGRSRAFALGPHDPRQSQQVPVQSGTHGKQSFPLCSSHSRKWSGCQIPPLETTSREGFLAEQGM